MPLLTFADPDGVQHHARFAEREEIRLGMDPAWSSVTLPGYPGLAAQHAVIMRSALNRLLLLVDLSGGQSWVNQHPVVQLRVLRQGDVLRLGCCDFTVWEVQITRLAEGDPVVGQHCPVSQRVFKPGDEVIACPGCGAIHGRAAWFLIERCAAGCGYPNQEVIIDTLPAWVHVEKSLDQESKLIERLGNDGKLLQDGKHCQAGRARDQVPFQARQNAVYCPSCQTPFHLECFVTLPVCPVCQYHIRELIDKTFLAQVSE